MAPAAGGLAPGTQVPTSQKNSCKAQASDSPALARAPCAHPRPAPPLPTHHNSVVVSINFHYPYYYFTVLRRGIVLYEY